MSRTTDAIRQAIQQSSESIRSLAERYGINPKTVAKWRRRDSVADGKSGRRDRGGSTLPIETQALIVAVRQHALLPLDDCLTVLQHFVPDLDRLTLYRCLNHHDISRRPTMSEASAPGIRDPRAGHFYMQMTEVDTPTNKLRFFTAVDRQSKFAFCECSEQGGSEAAAAFVQSLIKAIPYRIISVRTPALAEFSALPAGPEGNGKSKRTYAIHAFRSICVMHQIMHHLATDDHAWSMRQLEQVNHTIGKATLHRYQGNAMKRLGGDLERFLKEYNFNCRLKSLKGLSPYEYANKFAGPTARFRRENRTGSKRWRIPKKKGSLHHRRHLDSTREAILRAARICLAHDGPRGLSLSGIARRAGVSRGTAYLHFRSREALVNATVAGVSERLFRAVFNSSPEKHIPRPFDQVDAFERAYHLATAVMENPELGRGWMLQVLSSSDPAGDLFWREREADMERFAKSPLAQENIDPQVLNVIMLGGAVFFSVWANSKAKNKRDLNSLARRYAREVTRLTLYGTVRRELFPTLVKRLREEQLT